VEWRTGGDRRSGTRRAWGLGEDDRSPMTSGVWSLDTRTPVSRSRLVAIGRDQLRSRRRARGVAGLLGWPAGPRLVFFLDV
jgi:hypothetical protein